MTKQTYSPLKLLLFFSVILLLSTVMGSQSITNTQEKNPNFIYFGQFTSWNGTTFFASNYFASRKSGSWQLGISDCRIMFGVNSHLLSLETEQEQVWIDECLKFSEINVGRFWASGMYDLNHEFWRWAANPSVTFDQYTNWGVGEPRSINNKQRIAINFHNDSIYWEANDDTFLNRAICEVPVPVSTE